MAQLQTFATNITDTPLTVGALAAAVSASSAAHGHTHAAVAGDSFKGRVDHINSFKGRVVSGGTASASTHDAYADADEFGPLTTADGPTEKAIKFFGGAPEGMMSEEAVVAKLTRSGDVTAGCKLGIVFDSLEPPFKYKLRFDALPGGKKAGPFSSPTSWSASLFFFFVHTFSGRDGWWQLTARPMHTLKVARGCI